jgi:hypothetical protein
LAQKIVHLALIRKRAEISAYVLRYPSAKLGADLEAVDRVIRLFMPEFDPSKIAPSRPRKPYVTGRNHEVVGVLREAGRACSTVEIAAAIIAKRGLTLTKRERSDLVRSVGANLRHLRRIGRVTSERRGLLAWWALATKLQRD